MSYPSDRSVGKYFLVSNGDLLIGNVSIPALARKYGTPFFVYDKNTIDKKLDALRQALPSNFEVCYSVKANPNQTILRHFLGRNCPLEVASGGELYQALSAGCDPSRIFFAGPGKTETELEFAISHGIGEIHLESFAEATRVSAIARKRETRVNVAVRVNPAGSAEGGAMRMGGRPAAFGIDEELLGQMIRPLLADPMFVFRGIHIFAGTQILDASILIEQYRHGLDLAREASQLAGAPLHTVDFGGGLGIPYFAQERELDLDRLQAGLAELFTGIAGDSAFAGTHFFVEPGRFLVGEAGIYVARVIDVKVSRGKKFVVLDGGMNHHLAASGNLGQTIKRNYPVSILNKMDSAAEESVDVVGPLCTPLDTLARSVLLPSAEIGDFVGIFQSGAYGRSASPLGFLSHQAPAEVWVDEGEDCLIRRRGEYADHLRDQLSAVPAGNF